MGQKVFEVEMHVGYLKGLPNFQASLVSKMGQQIVSLQHHGSVEGEM
jgi:hypothetical protein